MKDYRDKELKFLYFALGVLMLIMATDSFSIDHFVSKYDMTIKIVECAAVSSVASIFAFLGDSIISSQLKAKLIGLFFIPLPGETVFSRISAEKIRDNRFTMSYAQEKYASIIEGIPDRKKCNRKQRRESYTYENAAWYKIYNSKRENPSIQLLHRDYLLCRDSNMACLLFLLLYFILTKLFRSIINFSGSFVLLLTSLIIITNICTHIKMNRFVSSVIAIDIAEEEKKK